MHSSDSRELFNPQQARLFSFRDIKGGTNELWTVGIAHTAVLLATHLARGPAESELNLKRLSSLDRLSKSSLDGGPVLRFDERDWPALSEVGKGQAKDLEGAGKKSNALGRLPIT
jgi:hypothetical protein